MYKVESDFWYRGHRCVVVFTELGHRCGYVSVDETNALYNKDYDDIDDIDVHGGLTYSGSSSDSNYPVESNLYWFGFDCAHSTDRGDYSKLLEYFPDDENIKYIATIEEFFCDIIQVTFNNSPNTYVPAPTIRTCEFVEDECKRLVDQIVAFDNKALE